MAVTVSASDAVPDLTAARPSYKNASSTVQDIPPATGNISVAQSPKGTSVTNTGRTAEATATFLATKLNILNVGTTPPPAKN